MSKNFGWRPRLAGLTVIATAAAILLIAPSAFANAVNTSDDPGVTGALGTPAACLNGQPGHTDPAVNCNIYVAKTDVFLSGSPDSAALSDGNYFFAILSPGGQPTPNDGTGSGDMGTPKNLSDDYDAWTNREFSLIGGTITMLNSSTHFYDSVHNEVQAAWFSNTLNNGGVYILAVCKVPATPTTGDGAPGVVPRDCKYDAFKVKESETSTASGPTITKDAAGAYNTTWTWGIDKSVDKTYVEQVGGNVTFNYTVSVTHNSGNNSVVTVTGQIQVFNPNVDGNGDTVPLDITSVTDALSDGTPCTVTGGGAQTLTLAETDFAYSCSLGAVPSVSIDNVATVTWPTQTINGTELTGNSDTFTVTGIDFTQTKIDDCVNVTDTYAGTLGTVCQGDPSPTTFKYSRSVPAPTLGTCVSPNNTATFTTDDTGTTGSDSQTVTVCAFRAALTIGYWGNHLANSAKTGSYTDSSCGKSLPNGTSCSSNGPWAKQYLPQYLGNYPVDTILKVAQVIAANNCSNASSSSQNAIACLAAQLLAAELNVANVANSCIITVHDGINDANSFLKSGVVDGVTGITYTGPTGSYTLSAAQRNEALVLKNKLVNYNQGGGC
jgi:hypothetical protein